MTMRTKRRQLNYRCLYNYRLSLVLEAAFEDFKKNFNAQGGSLNEASDSVQQLAESYRHFKKFAMRFAISH